jgi:hypothetical protein
LTIYFLPGNPFHQARAGVWVKSGGGVNLPA